MNFLKRNFSHDFGIILFLVTISLIVRFLLSMPVEQWGDNTFKWAMIRVYVEDGVMPSQRLLSTHHALRWAINIPVLVIQKFFGTAPQNYYIWPFLSTTVGAVFSYLIAKNIHSRFLGIIAAITFMFLTPILRQGTQFLPMGSAVMYMLGSVYFLQVWINTKRLSTLMLCGIFLFFSYGSKITSIYYFPAFAILILLFSKGSEEKLTDSYLKPLTCFFLLLAILFGAEAILTQKLTHVPWGRIACIAKGQHGDTAVRKQMHAASITEKNWKVVSTTFGEYISNIFVFYKFYPKNKPMFAKLLLYIALLLAIAVLIFKKRELYIISIPYLFGFFGHAYAIVSVYPFLRPERMNFRYQTVIFTLATLLIITFLGSLDKQQILKTKKSSLKVIQRYYLLLSLVLTLLFISTSGTPKPFTNGYVKTKQNYNAIKKARERRESILIETKASFSNRRRLHLLYLSLYSPTSNYYTKSAPGSYDFKIFKKRNKTFLLMEDNGNIPFSFNQPHIIIKP